MIALKNSSGMFLCAEGGGGRELIGNRAVAAEWEHFTMLPAGVGNMVALRTHDGHFVCAEFGGGGKVICDRDAVAPWESFSLIKHADTSVSFRCWDGKHYLCSDQGVLGGLVVADRTNVGAWETFTIDPPLTPPLTVPLRLLQVGPVWADTSGAIVHEREVTAFTLFGDWLNGRANVEPFIVWARDTLQANTLRVFGMLSWAGGPWPDFRQAGAYANQAREFVKFCGMRGMRVSFNLFADAQVLCQDEGTQDRLHAATTDALADLPNVFYVLANEKYVGINYVDADRLGQHRPAGLRMSRGCENYTEGAWTFCTNHSDRDNEWERKGKDPATELYGGLHNETTQFDGYHVPVHLEEPMGAGEVQSGGGGARDTDPTKFFDYAANGVIFAAGSCFHFQDGMRARLPGPTQQRCADGFRDGWNSLPAGLADWGSYTRSGLADCPLEWNGDALRIYAKQGNTEGYALAIQPASHWIARPRDGWRIVTQRGPQGRVVHLQR